MSEVQDETNFPSPVYQNDLNYSYCSRFFTVALDVMLYADFNAMHIYKAAAFSRCILHSS